MAAHRPLLPITPTKKAPLLLYVGAHAANVAKVSLTYSNGSTTTTVLDKVPPVFIWGNYVLVWVPGIRIGLAAGDTATLIVTLLDAGNHEVESSTDIPFGIGDPPDTYGAPPTPPAPAARK